MSSLVPMSMRIWETRYRSSCLGATDLEAGLQADVAPVAEQVIQASPKAKQAHESKLKAKKKAEANVEAKKGKAPKPAARKKGKYSEIRICSILWKRATSGVFLMILPRKIYMKAKIWMFPPICAAG
jgi:hypothetical protein